MELWSAIVYKLYSRITVASYSVIYNTRTRNVCLYVYLSQDGYPYIILHDSHLILSLVRKQEDFSMTKTNRPLAIVNKFEQIWEMSSSEQVSKRSLGVPMW